MGLIRFFVCIISVAALHLTANAQREKEPPYLILVSFDGFRHDYVGKFALPNFSEFIAKGSSAEALIPAFPSKTFPNHYSTVTGLYPGSHGLVDNSFYDPQLKTLYTMSDRDKVVDPVFYGGTSIWRLAREAGMKSASYFWVGSEVNDEDLRPDYYFEYDGTVHPKTRIEKVISWLELPKETRPHFIALYFSSPDYEAHLHGPSGYETRDAALQADSLLGYLMTRLKQIELPVNVMVTSDHGLTDIVIGSDTYVYLDQFVAVKNTSYRIVNGGTHAHFYTRTAEQTDSLYRLLHDRDSRMKVYRKEDLPAEWHYNHSRVGDLLVVANHPFYLRNSFGGYLRDGKPGSVRGVHGYDPKEVNDMHGVFFAQGPNIRQGFQLKAIRNVDLYPLMARILNLRPPSIDGTGEETLKLYRRKK
jgi:alkaline phosphatase D